MRLLFSCQSFLASESENCIWRAFDCALIQPPLIFPGGNSGSNLERELLFFLLSVSFLFCFSVCLFLFFLLSYFVLFFPLVYLRKQPLDSINLKPWPNGLASRLKSTQVCKTRTCVQTCEVWPNEFASRLASRKRPCISRISLVNAFL